MYFSILRRPRPPQGCRADDDDDDDDSDDFSILEAISHVENCNTST